MPSFRQMHVCRLDPEDAEPTIQALKNYLEIAVLRVNYELIPNDVENRQIL